MKRKTRVFIAALIAATLVHTGLVGCAGASGAADGGAKHAEVNTLYELEGRDVKFDTGQAYGYISGIVTVWFEPDATAEIRTSAIEAVNGEVVGQLDAFDQMQLSVSATDEEELNGVCATLEEQEGVAFADLDRVVLTDSVRHIPNDDWEGDGYLPNGSAWWLDVIDAPEAWSLIDDGDIESAKLGLVDAGFDMEHEDLKASLSYASEADGEYRAPSYHGSHVAGLLAAERDNETGIAGVNSKAEVLCFDGSPTTKFDEESGYLFTDTSLLLGLYETVTNGAKVVNFSVGAPGEWSQEVIDISSAKYSRAMGMLLEKGYDFIVVQAAGNSGVDARNACLFAGITKDNCDEAFAPAEDIVDRILVVAACDSNFSWDSRQIEPQIASFSNDGSQVTVCAPGDDLLSCLPENQYGQMSGTSMAAPIVTGVCGLVWGAAPELAGSDVVEIVKTSYRQKALDSSDNKVKGGMPVVNANLAVRKALRTTGQMSEHDNVVGLYQCYLMNIIDAADSFEGDFPVVDLTYRGDVLRQLYYGFAIGDMDNDGVPNLFVSYEEQSADTLCPNVVYDIDPDTGEVFELERSGLIERINGARFYRNQVIELGTSYADSAYYLGANKDFYEQLGIPEGQLLYLGIVGGDKSMGTTSYFAFNQGPVAVSADYMDEIQAALTSDGQLDIEYQAFTQDNIEKLSASSIPEIKAYKEHALPALSFSSVGGDTPRSSGAEDTDVSGAQVFVGVWETVGGDWPNTSVTVMESGEFYIEGSPYEGSNVQDSGTWRVLESMDAYGRPGATGIILEGSNENYWMSYDGSLMMFHFFEAVSPMKQIA